MDRKLVFIPIIVALQLAVNIFVGAAWVCKVNGQGIPHGITVQGRDIGGFDSPHAIAYLRSIKGKPQLDKEIVLTDGPRKWTLETRMIGVRFDYPKTIETVLTRNKSHGKLGKIADMLMLQAGSVDVPLVMSWNESALVSFLDSINKEIYAPARDARSGYSEGRFSIEKEVQGQQLDYKKTISLILQNIRSNSQAPIPIAKKRLTVRIQAEDLHTIDAVLSTFATPLDGNRNRTTNISEASRLINGKVIMPGDEFSFNDSVGERTREKGYMDAPVIVQGKIVNDLGGGICQVATTLYNASLKAGLAVTEHHPHSLNVKYVPPGKDATVVFDQLDLKVKNVHPNPISFSSKVMGSELVVTVLGNHTDKK